MNSLMNEKPLTAGTDSQSFAAEENHGGILWHLQVDLVHEGFAWCGKATACSGNDPFSLLKSLRYGPTAEKAFHAAVETLHEAIVIRTSCEQRQQVQT